MKKRGLLLAILLVLCFVWGNSLQDRETSKAISMATMNFLRSWFPIFNGITHSNLRKMGHFSEFLLLGALLAWFYRNQQGIHRLTMPLLLVLLAANMDETIQLIALGRGSDVLDVWIDTAGACVGIAVVTLVQFWRRRK